MSQKCCSSHFSIRRHHFRTYYHDCTYSKSVTFRGRFWYPLRISFTFAQNLKKFFKIMCILKIFQQPVATLFTNEMILKRHENTKKTFQAFSTFKVILQNIFQIFYDILKIITHRTRWHSDSTKNASDHSGPRRHSRSRWNHFWTFQNPFQSHMSV